MLKENQKDCLFVYRRESCKPAQQQICLVSTYFDVLMVVYHCIYIFSYNSYYACMSVYFGFMQYLQVVCCAVYFCIAVLCVCFEEDHSNQKTRADDDKDKELEALRTKV